MEYLGFALSLLLIGVLCRCRNVLALFSNFKVEFTSSAQSTPLLGRLHLELVLTFESILVCIGEYELKRN